MKGVVHAFHNASHARHLPCHHLPRKYKESDDAPRPHESVEATVVDLAIRQPLSMPWRKSQIPKNPTHGTCHQIRHEHKRNYQTPMRHVDLVGWVDWPSWQKVVRDSIVSRQRRRRETYSRVASRHSHQRRIILHSTVRRHGATVRRVGCLHWFRPCTIRWSEQKSMSYLRHRRHHVQERQRKCDPSKFCGCCCRGGQKVAWRLPLQQDPDMPICCSWAMFPARCCCCCYGYSCPLSRLIS